MAIDNGKIKTLLAQRQKLRVGLAELRKDIDALDASAISVVTDAGHDQPGAQPKSTPGTTAAPATATADADKSKPPATEKSAPQSVSQNKAPTTMTDDVSPIQVKSPTAGGASGTAQMGGGGNSDAASLSAQADGSAAKAGHDKNMIKHARLLAAYFIEHPAPVNNSDLVALDMALDHYDQASMAADKKKAEASVKDSYRTVASASYTLLGINGQTLADSMKGSWLICAVPLLITALVLAAIPLGTLIIILTNKMLAPGFAAEVRWIIGVFLAFFWGFAGALSLIAYRFSSDIAQGSFRAKGAHSVGLWGGMGGLSGAIIYMLIEWLFDFTGVEAGFAIDIGAFIGGMFSRLLFELLAKLVSLFTHGGKADEAAAKH